VLPSVLVLFVFIILPLMAAWVSSFFNFTIMLDSFEFAGLQQYRAVLKDRRFWNSLKNTVSFTLAVVPIQNALSLLTAAALRQVNKINVLFRTIFFLPVVCSMTIIAMSLAMIFNGYFGFLPALLSELGFPPADLLNDVRYAMPTVMLISVYKNFGFTMVIYIAAYQMVPRYLYEAAGIDGAGSIKKFISVTLPAIAPTLTFCLITSTISSFQVFDQVYVTTKGGPLFSTETAVQFIYERAFVTNEMPFANANAVLLFLLILSATLLVRKLRGNSEFQY
jgi:multiple sugar transport system permease protein